MLLIKLREKISSGLDHRKMVVKKSVLLHWKNLITELMKENIKYEAAQEKILLQFKYVKFQISILSNDQNNRIK